MKTRDRPPIKLSLDWLDRLLIAGAALALILNLALAFFAHDVLPARIPMKFGFSGEPTAWADKGFIWLLPVVAVFSTILVGAVASAPHTHNFPWTLNERNAEPLYRLSRRLCFWVLNSILFIFAYSNYFVIQVALGNESVLPIWFLPLVLVSVVIPLIWYYRQGRRIAKGP